MKPELKIFFVHLTWWTKPAVPPGFLRLHNKCPCKLNEELFPHSLQLHYVFALASIFAKPEWRKTSVYKGMLATQATLFLTTFIKMNMVGLVSKNQILLWDWLPEWERWRLNYAVCPIRIFPLAKAGSSKPIKQIFFCMPKLVQSRWPWFFFGMLMDLESLLVHKQAKTGLGQYPAILTSCWANNPCISS